MLKTRQVRRCQGLEKLWRHLVAMRNPQCRIFIAYRSKNDSFVAEQILSMSKNH